MRITEKSIDREQRHLNRIKKILVTGSSGMIGTALCEELIQNNYQVIGVDLRHNKWQTSVDKATIICDLRDRNFFNLLPNDFDLVIHLAANARVYNTMLQPQLTRDNFEILFNILEFSRLHNTKRLIFAGSREIYGNSDKVLLNEAEVTSLERCESPYAATKIGAEAMVFAYHRCYGMGTLVLRFSNVYGKYDDSDRVMPFFVNSAIRGQNLVVFGKEKILDFTYISDCVAGIIQSIRKFDQVDGTVFNIATGKGTKLLDVARLIQAGIGIKGGITLKESRTGEVTKFTADISRARELLDYQPAVSIEEGILKTIQWYQTTGRSGCV